MRLGHFERLNPVCPHCLWTRGTAVPLALGVVEAEVAGPEGGDVRWGTLLCTDPGCAMEYPIVDGAPVLVPDPRGWMAANGHLLTTRADIPPVMEGVLGDAFGPDSAFNATRQHLSSYGWDHYGDRDRQPGGEAEAAGSVVRCLSAGLGRLGPLPAGPILDLGCAAGRTSFELAGRTDDLVLGLDLHWPLLALARHVLDTGEAVYPLRRSGIVYERRRAEARFPGAERVDFWIGDALAPPFAPGSFALVTAMNLLDCVASPPALLHAIDRAVAEGGGALLATPFDWATQATPVEAWLGGHSQRGDDAGRCEAVLARLLTPGAHAQSVTRLRLDGEPLEVPWTVRMHDRARMQYAAHLVALRA
ncbi:methyltransferase domain-containing protein [Azospirillum doebereinerae]|uniref:Methyltransferase domain-containing protein n=1 Tax=Azospirillum doebereinerae TaxID=92933 RepID=A0A433JFB7_9PROT|nr:methyltransferase domain-containing protein [Azospirillum doebereinerae]RUQ75866.1 methyltransferase domain-containing protein [Azospirillum doebereinerae]